MDHSKKSFYQLSFLELTNILKAHKLSPSAGTLLFRHHYKEKKLTPCEHHNLSRNSRHFMQRCFDFSLPFIKEVQEAEDLTAKFIIQLSDGEKIESVLIPFQNKYTLCLSTQVGCAMKCSFCFTGTQGLKRNLTTDEIVGQFLLAWNWLLQNRPSDYFIKNIVYMGQGEPLHNFDAIKKANHIFIDQHGMSLGIQKITVSTAGYLPGLKRWKNEMPGVNLALSLHSTDEEKRNHLIPLNKRYPLQEIMESIEAIPLARKQYITYEYLLIKDFNDTSEDANKTGKFLFGKKAIVNLIPFNPFPGSILKRSPDDKIHSFKKIIESYNLPAIVRSTKGDAILAACGQLNTNLK